MHSAVRIFVFGPIFLAVAPGPSIAGAADLENRPPCSATAASGRLGLKTPQLIQREGYPYQVHSVQTQDGYIIEIHRIPQPGKPPVFLMPGIFQSSRDFFMNCNDRALPFMLYNAGFDVWLGNYRGSSNYGRSHLTLKSDRRPFWEFTTQDIMKYDCPAMIDYVLTNTNHEKLSWIGFSLGNTVMFGMLSLRPEYNAKLTAGVVLGNAVYFNHTTNRGLKLLARNKNFVEAFARKTWHGEITPPALSSILQQLIPQVCLAEAHASSFGVCSAGAQVLGLYNPAQTNVAYLPQILSGFPSSVGYKVVGQWFQWINSGVFSTYDSEKTSWRNSLIRARDLPVLRLSDTRIPILNFWSPTDHITSKTDVLRAVEELPNVVENVEVKAGKWGHIDYLYGKDADVVVYEKVVNFLLKQVSV